MSSEFEENSRGIYKSESWEIAARETPAFNVRKVIYRLDTFLVDGVLEHANEMMGRDPKYEGISSRTSEVKDPKASCVWVKT